MTLQKLNEQFRHIAPRLDIVSFYETMPTRIKSARVVRRVHKHFFSVKPFANPIEQDGFGKSVICLRLSWRSIKGIERRSSRDLQI